MSAKHIAIIPARAGSKSIIDKNLVKIQDRSLIRIAIDQAMGSKIFSHVLLSTDIPKMRIDLEGITHSNAMTAFEVVNRPKELCTDDALMMDVVKHAMKHLGNFYEYVWLLQPTAPFRRKEDFENIKKIMEEGYYDSVISFKPVHEHPSRMYTMKQDEDDHVKAFKLNKSTGFQNKQELSGVYIRSGNFYVSKRELLLEHSSFENKPIYPFGVTRIKGTNIDSEEDLVLAKHWVSKGTIKV